MDKDITDHVEGINICGQINATYINALKKIGFTDAQAIKICEEKGIKINK